MTKRQTKVIEAIKQFKEKFEGNPTGHQIQTIVGWSRANFQEFLKKDKNKTIKAKAGKPSPEYIINVNTNEGK